MNYRQFISNRLSLGQKWMVKDFISKYQNLKRRYSHRSKFSLSNKILVGTHHKTGTSWLVSIFREICRKYSLKLFYGEQVDLTAKYDVFIQDHSKFDLVALGEHLRGLHIIRDPRDVIISGCFYHQTSMEESLHIPREHYQGLSYQEMLRRCNNLDEQIHFEMEHASKSTINDMVKWNYTHESFFEVKYEDLIVDTDLMLFHRIFIFLGFPAPTLPALLKIAYDNSLFSDLQKKGGHIRSGEPGQWKKYFKESHKYRFLELFGDALIFMGYEKDNNWVKSR
jgi:hypothetical protein